MVVLDDYLEREQFLALQAAVESPLFPWETSGILKDPPAHLSAAQNQQQVHGFFLRNARRQYVSPCFAMLRPLIERLTPLDLIKAKVNRTARQERHIEYGLHLDTQRPGATTAVFYLNSNNGYTLFEDGARVASVANRLVLFDASRSHTGASCTDAEYRLVLNLNMMLPADARPSS